MKVKKYKQKKKPQRICERCGSAATSKKPIYRCPYCGWWNDGNQAETTKGTLEGDR